MNAVVIPALNEQSSIEATLAQIPRNYFVIVVIGLGNADDTPLIARQMGAKVLESEGETYGETVMTGLKEAKDCENVIVMDCESHRFAEVEPYIGQADVVAGRRRKSHQNIWRRFISFMAMGLVAVSIEDVSNGFRCYSKKAVEVILSQESYLKNVPSYCFNIEVARLLQARKTVEFPMEYTDGKSGLTKKELWKVVRWYLHP